MAFQFCCPQGHVLQGETSQVGQLFQCPMCGVSFLIPPEATPAVGGGFFQGPAAWPAPGGFPAPGVMPGVMPQPMPMIPGGQMPSGAFPSPFPATLPATQPNPAAAPPPQAAPPPPAESGKPRFDLGFDPHAKAELPFDLPGQSEPDAGQATAAPEPAPPLAPSFPPAAFPGSSFPAPAFPGSPLPSAGFPPSSTSLPPGVPAIGDQSEAASAAAAEPAEPAPALQTLPKVLHIRCPSGHLVKATSDLLGKKRSLSGLQEDLRATLRRQH